MSIGLNLKNTYTDLPDLFYSKVQCSKLDHAKLQWWNCALAKELGINQGSSEQAEQIFSGNMLPQNGASVAQAYAGHQFGHFTMLGDGRAILLGEHLTANGERFDIQLKGSGRTPYSRNGDGKATLYSMLRECLISEMMFKLNIPTSRSLALVDSGEQIQRETTQPGAVLTRVAKSHLRVGTFEMARRFGTKADLKAIADYAINRHFPKLNEGKDKYLSFLKAVMEVQITTIVGWMRVGFIHGVMNTDNMSISGETFDYGPCAFLNNYDPNKRYSSIDKQGRYAFGNQAQIAMWNLARLAESLIPLLSDNNEKGLELAQHTMDQFPIWYETEFYAMMNKKIGLSSAEGRGLVNELLELMQENHLDYTYSFLYLEWVCIQGKGQPDKKFKVLDAWVEKWKKQLARLESSSCLKLMQANNPVLIPRNGEVEKVLINVSSTGQINSFTDFLKEYDQLYKRSEFSISNYSASYSEDDSYQTYCGT